MPEMHPRPQLARRARPLRSCLCLARLHSPQWGRSPCLPSPSPSNADGTYSTTHRKKADHLYYQGINEGVYNTIHRKNATTSTTRGRTKQSPPRPRQPQSHSSSSSSSSSDSVTQPPCREQPPLPATTGTQHERTPQGLAQPVSPGPWGPQDEEFEPEAWSSILDYVPGIHNNQQKPRKSKSQGEQADRAQKTPIAQPTTAQPPAAQPPPPEAPDVTREHHNSKSSRQDLQTSTTNTTAPTRGALRGLSPLAAGAARAIPQATHAPAKHGDDVYYQKAAPPGSEHEAKGTHDHLVPTKTTLETHNNYNDYLPALEPAPDAQPRPALLVPPGGRAPQHRGLHPDQDVFEDAYPTGEAHDHPQEASGDPPGTATDETEEPDWSRDSHDEADETNNVDTANHDISEPPRCTWGSRRPAEPEGTPPPRPPNGYTNREASPVEETRTERNRRARAEWRQWRRLRRRMGLEPGYFYPSGADWKRRT